MLARHVWEDEEVPWIPSFHLPPTHFCIQTREFDIYPPPPLPLPPNSPIQTHPKITGNASDTFHDLVQNRPNDISTVHPDLVQACHLHEGDFGVPGSIIEWKYSIDGVPKTMKELVEVVDEENKMIKFKCLEGDEMKYYNSFYITIQVFPKDNETSVVRYTFEYEKSEPNHPDPTDLMDELIQLVKEIEAHHHSQNK